MTLCLILDENVAFLARGLRRRGFIVYVPGKDYPQGTSDTVLCEAARRLGCIVVSTDAYFASCPHGIHIPHDRLHAKSTIDITTWIVKEAARKIRTLKP